MSQKRTTDKDSTYRPCERCDCYVRNSEDNYKNNKSAKNKRDDSNSKWPLTRVLITTTDYNGSSSDTTNTKVSLEDSSSEVLQKGDPKSAKYTDPIEQRDSELKPEEKRKCFCCPKRKKKDKNSAAQTTEVDLKNNPTQSSETDIKKPGKNKNNIKKGDDDSDLGPVEKRIGDVISDNSCPHCKKTNGLCNTNTIVFPRDQVLRNNRFYDDGLENLRHLIKTEARWNSRAMEDILRELDKQRRDIKELKEMFELFVRLSKENLMYQAFANNDNLKRRSLLKNDNGDKSDDKHDLERKSNSTSINSLDPEEKRPHQDSYDIIKKEIHNELERDVNPPKKKAGWFKCFG